MKNTLDFIKKSKEMTGGEYDSDNDYNDIRTVLTEDLRLDIINRQGPEFDIYLKGLFYRDFDTKTIPM